MILLSPCRVTDLGRARSERTGGMILLSPCRVTDLGRARSERTGGMILLSPCRVTDLGRARSEPTGGSKARCFCQTVQKVQIFKSSRLLGRRKIHIFILFF